MQNEDQNTSNKMDEMKKNLKQFGNKAKEGMEKAGEKVKEVSGKVGDEIEKNPKKAAAISLGIGALLGGLVAAILGRKKK